MCSVRSRRPRPRARTALPPVLRTVTTTAVILWLGAALYLDHRSGVHAKVLTPCLAVSALGPVALLLVRAVRPHRLPAGATAAAGAAVAVLSLGTTAVMRRLAGRPDAPVDRADAYTFFELTALVLVLAVTVRHGAPRTTAVAAPLLLTAVVLRPVAVDVDEGSLIVTLFSGLVAGAVLAGALGLRLVLADRRRREEHLRLEQRIAFARDLHDYVAHHVMGIVVHAQGAQAVAAAEPEVVVPALAQIEEAGTDALRALRRMVGGLRSPDGAEEHTPQGDVDRLRALVTGFTLPGAGIRLVEQGPLAELPPGTVTVLHHVVMESLTNVRKHATGARRVTVRLSVLPEHADVAVTDDGVSRPAHSRGYGLTGLDERVTTAGGTFDAGTDARGNWCVSARLPLPRTVSS